MSLAAGVLASLTILIALLLAPSKSLATDTGQSDDVNIIDIMDVYLGIRDVYKCCDCHTEC